MNNLQSFLQTVDSLVWGPPLLILLVGTGVYFTFRLGLLQFRRLPTALAMVFGRENLQTNKVMYQASPHCVLLFLPPLVLETS